MFLRAERFARAFVRGLPRQMRAAVDVDDVTSDAQVAVLGAWRSCPPGLGLDEFWSTIAENVLTEALGETTKAGLPVVELEQHGWFEHVVHGTERFVSSSPATSTSVTLDSDFATKFFEAAAVQVSHVLDVLARSDSGTAPPECSCGHLEHDSVIRFGARWHHGRRRRSTKLAEMKDFLVSPRPAESVRALEHAVARVGRTGDLTTCCAAMWFGVNCLRVEDRERRNRHDDPSTARATFRPTDQHSFDLFGTGMLDPEDSSLIEWVMDVAHRTLAGLQIVQDGPPILTITNLSTIPTAVRPTAPTRVLLPRVMRQVFLAIAAGDHRSTFYKLALAASARVLRPEPLPSDAPDRDAVDQAVRRAAVNTVFVLWQRSVFGLPVAGAETSEQLRLQLMESAHVSQERLEQLMTDRLPRSGVEGITEILEPRIP